MIWRVDYEIEAFLSLILLLSYKIFSYHVCIFAP